MAGVAEMPAKVRAAMFAVSNLPAVSGKPGELRGGEPCRHDSRGLCKTAQLVQYSSWIEEGVFMAALRGNRLAFPSKEMAAGPAEHPLVPGRGEVLLVIGFQEFAGAGKRVIRLSCLPGNGQQWLAPCL